MITTLIVLSLTFGLLIVLPLMIVGLVLKVGLTILLLPFKLLGGALRLVSAPGGPFLPSFASSSWSESGVLSDSSWRASCFSSSCPRFRSCWSAPSSGWHAGVAAPASPAEPRRDPPALVQRPLQSHTPAFKLLQNCDIAGTRRDVTVSRLDCE